MNLIEPVSLAPGVSASESSASAATSASSRGARWRLTIACHASPPVREEGVEEGGGRQKRWTTEVLWVLEHEEEVHVSNQDSNQLHDSATCNDHVEAEEDPGQIHSLELGSEPEAYDLVLVELAPHVEDGEHHGVHQHRDLHEEADDDAEDPVEDEHEEVVGRPPVENTGFKTQAVVVEEV